MRQTGRHSTHANANTNSNRTGEAEDNIGQDEVPEAEVGLGNVETQTEGHDGFVDNNSNEDWEQTTLFLL